MRPGSLKTPQQEVYSRKAARLYQQGITMPLILVGGIRSCGMAKKLVRAGKADYISTSRPLMCEPGLVKRWREVVWPPYWDRQKNARQGRNPQTKEALMLKARKGLAFKTSGVLRQRMNRSENPMHGPCETLYEKMLPKSANGWQISQNLERIPCVFSTTAVRWKLLEIAR
jgi:hypothetical protein